MRIRCFMNAAAGLALVVGLGWGSTATAAAAPHATPVASTWKVVPPATPGGKDAIFSSVSCPTSSFCMAVGDEASATRDHAPVAETFNGKTWTLRYPNNVKSGVGVGLTGVSCPSSTDCTAVGVYGLNATQVVAEHWDGQTWNFENIVSPANAGTRLDSVSCPSTTTCLAVGATNLVHSPSSDLAEVWHSGGVGWKITALPATSGAFQGPELTSVSCSTPSTCVAIGGQSTSTGTLGYVAANWNGSRWSRVGLPSAANPVGFNGVSCSTPGNCVAVGQTSVGTAESAVLRYGTWTVHGLQTVNGEESGPIAVSCTSNDSCYEAGTTANAGRPARTVAGTQYWTGTRWVPLHTPNPNPPVSFSSGLTGISCTSTSECVAVGVHEQTEGDLQLASEQGGAMLPLG